MLRGLRQHAHKLLKQLQEGDVERANLGLGVRLPTCDPELLKPWTDGMRKFHSTRIRGQGLSSVYRRMTIILSVSCFPFAGIISLNLFAEAIATLDNLDKAVNMFSMRVREWYSWVNIFLLPSAVLPLPRNIFVGGIPEHFRCHSACSSCPFEMRERMLKRKIVSSIFQSLSGSLATTILTQSWLSSLDPRRDCPTQICMS